MVKFLHFNTQIPSHFFSSLVLKSLLKQDLQVIERNDESQLRLEQGHNLYTGIKSSFIFVSNSLKIKIFGRNNKEQASTWMLLGVCQEIKKQLGNPQNIQQVKSKSVLINQYWVKNFWLKRDFLYLHIVLFELSFQLQNYSIDIIRQQNVWKQVRQLFITKFTNELRIKQYVQKVFGTSQIFPLPKSQQEVEQKFSQKDQEPREQQNYPQEKSLEEQIQQNSQKDSLPNKKTLEEIKANEEKNQKEQTAAQILKEKETKNIVEQNQANSSLKQSISDSLRNPLTFSSRRDENLREQIQNSIRIRQSQKLQREQPKEQNTEEKKNEEVLVDQAESEKYVSQENLNEQADKSEKKQIHESVKNNENSSQKQTVRNQQKEIQLKQESRTQVKEEKSKQQVLNIQRTSPEEEDQKHQNDEKEPMGQMKPRATKAKEKTAHNDGQNCKCQIY